MILTVSFVRLCVAGSLGLVLAMTASVLAQSATEKKAAVFKVLLPADAVLEVDGFRSGSTGEARRFESPPVAVGHTYSYPIKATWKGKTISRTIEIRPDQETTLDLRDAWKEEIAPALSKITLALPSELTLEAGKEVPLTVSLKREGYPGAVVLRAVQLPPGVTSKEGKIAAQESTGRMILAAGPTAPATMSEVVVVGSGETVEGRATLRLTIKIVPTLPPSMTLMLPLMLTVKAGQETTLPISLKCVNVRAPVTLRIEDLPDGVTSGEITPTPGEEKVRFRVMAAPTAAATTGDVTVLATADSVSSRATFRLTVEASSPPETVTPPKPSPTLALVLPTALTVEPGSAAYAEVRVLPREGAAMEGEPEVTLAVPAASKLHAIPWTAFPSNGRRSGVIRGFALRAEDSAAEGEYEARATARQGPDTVSETFKVTVRKVARPVEPKPAPPELVLTMPPDLTLEPGGRGYAEVRVRLRDGELSAEPNVDVSAPTASGLRIEPWTSFPLNKKVGAVRGYSVRVDPGASEGEREVKVTARLGDSATSATFKVRIKKPAKESSGGG